MRKLQRSLLVSAVGTRNCGIRQRPPQQFSNVYFFGDSLTDAGSFKPVLPPGTGSVHDESRPDLGAGIRGESWHSP